MGKIPVLSNLSLLRWNSVGLAFTALNLGVTAQYSAICSYTPKTVATWLRGYVRDWHCFRGILAGYSCS